MIVIHESILEAAKTKWKHKIYVWKNLRKTRPQNRKHTRCILTQHIWSIDLTRCCNSRINIPATLSNLSPVTCQRRDISHLNHGLGKLLKEKLVVPGIFLDQFHWCFIACQENLVRAQQSLWSQYVIEVAVVELCWTYKVQEKQVLVTSWSGAPSAQLSSKWLLKSGIRLPISWLVVKPLPEAGAPSISNCVAPWTKVFGT